MRILIASLVLTSSLLFAAPTSESQKTPNFSGKWKADMSKSVFPGGAPQDMILVIRDEPSTMFLTQTITSEDGNTQSGDFKVDKTGKESVNYMGDTEVRTVMTADGDVLNEKSEFTTSSGRLARKSTLSMSRDGKVLTLDGVYTGIGPEDKKIKIVFNKESR